MSKGQDLPEIEDKTPLYKEIKELYLLEDRQVFSKSMVWPLQHHYYAEKGIEAWRQGDVPHYITSNPRVANNYAEIVWAFWLEQNTLLEKPSVQPERQYIIELGAGSGRFSFHFLTQLASLCELGKVEPESFCYVLTDFAQTNLDFMRSHPRFQPFFQSGLLDLALFDINETDKIELQISGKTISSFSLDRPLIVFANYVFDSVPQDLFYFEDETSYLGVVSVAADTDPTEIPISQLPEHLFFRYDFEPLDGQPYAENDYAQLFTSCHQQLTNTHFLFPIGVLNCLKRLEQFSQSGLLVLSADKGEHRLKGLEGLALPQFVQHGSLSLNVNYHVLKTYCIQQGGVVFLPELPGTNIGVYGFLFGKEAHCYFQTKNAYQQHVANFSPDDYYNLISHCNETIDTLNFKQMIAYLRLGYYDSHLLTYFLPHLIKLAPEFNLDEREVVIFAVEQAWKIYFPLGEENNLANRIATLLYTIEEYSLAHLYFERSVAIYGPDTGTLYNIALCNYLLNQFTEAKGLLEIILQNEPTNQLAKDLLAEILTS
jgi:hypothetical protein